MSEAEGGKMSDRKWPRPVLLCIIPLLSGLFGFHRVAESPQFESYRTMDVVQLLLSGACMGVTLVVLMMWLVRPKG